MFRRSIGTIPLSWGSAYFRFDSYGNISQLKFLDNEKSRIFYRYAIRFCK